MSSEKVNPIKDQSFAISPSAMSASSVDVPPPPYSSLYPPAGPYGPIQMNSAVPTLSPFYPTQNGSIVPPPPPQMIGPPPMMATPTIGHQIYPTIGQHHYIPTTAQPYGLYQTVVPMAYGPMMTPVQFPIATNTSPTPAMMIPSTDPCFDPRAHSRALDIEMARQTIPIPPFSLTTVPQANMALMYGLGHNGTMLVSKPSKKQFY